MKNLTFTTIIAIVIQLVALVSIISSCSQDITKTKVKCSSKLAKAKKAYYYQIQFN